MRLISFLLQTKSKHSGFTLIELLVTLIIVAILSAIALPNFIYQVGKSREAETKGTLGNVGRAQQSYHWENRTFANDVSLLTGISSVGFDTSYHNLPNPATVSSDLVKHQAIAIDANNDQVRNFAIGIYNNNGLYDIAVCQSAGINDTVNVGDTAPAPCTNGGTKLR